MYSVIYCVSICVYRVPKNCLASSHIVKCYERRIIKTKSITFCGARWGNINPSSNIFGQEDLEILIRVLIDFAVLFSTRPKSVVSLL